MFKEVYGTVIQAQNKPWSNLTILFELLGSSSGLVGLFPNQMSVARTDSHGYFTTKLWVNETEGTTNYKCSYWGAAWVLNLTGDEVPASLSELIAQVPNPVVAVKGREVFFPTNNQAVFTLSRAAVYPQNTNVWLNGVRARLGVDFLVDGIKLTWQGVLLDSQDTLEVAYQ